MTKVFPVTKLSEDKITPQVLVCGDPQRATKISELLEDAQLVNEHREYRAYCGQFGGRDVMVCSHGIGAPGAAPCFEELIAGGAKTIIRVGTCGGLQPEIYSGDLVIAVGAVDATGYGRQSVPEGYPAVASPEVVLALQNVAQVKGISSQIGIVLTADNFYAGVTTPYTPNYQVMSEAQVQAVEMECSALFHVGNLRGAQTGSILAVDGNVLDTGETMESYKPHRDVVNTAVSNAIKIALHALIKI